MRRDNIVNEEKMLRREERLNLFADRTMLPKEIVSGCCNITAVGQNELIIENYKSILEYQPEKLVVLTKQCRVEIFGKHLEIVYYAKEEMKITGRIECINYKNSR